MNFSKILKSLRKEYNLTQKELGEIIGKSNRVISYYENEQSDNNLPDNETLYKLAKHFNVSINYLIGLDDNKKNPEMVLIEKIIQKTEKNILKWEKVDVEKKIDFALKDILKSPDLNFSTGNSEEFLYEFSKKIDPENIFTADIDDAVYYLFRCLNKTFLGDKFILTLGIYIFDDNNNDNDKILIINNEQVDGYMSDLFSIIYEKVNIGTTATIKSLIDSLDKLE